MISRFALMVSCAVCTLLIAYSCRKNNPTYSIDEPVVSSSHILIADTNQVNEAFGGYYVALPHNYDSTRAKFPLLIFLHGLGQRGDGKEQLPYLLFDGIGKVIATNRLPVDFTVQGEKFSFIIVSPQYNRQPNEDEVMQLTDSIIRKFRVRTNRVYLSGLSLGSRIATLTASKYPLRFAAVLPIAGVATNDSMQVRCETIARSNLPVWALHNVDDPMSNVNDTRRFVDYITQSHPPIMPRITVFDQYGHDAWTKALDTAYREDGKNVYEWMLQYYR